MFTGIIERIGSLAARDLNPDGSGGVEIRSAAWEAELLRGESVAVSGACLSLENFKLANGGVAMTFSVLKETFDRTNLGSVPLGCELNLERAMRADSRLGGHFVAGHVDAVCRVSAMRRTGRDWRLDIECGAELCRQMVPKGSVAVDGVSLTIAALSEEGFRVHLIPITMEGTSLRRLKAGSLVNIETDMIGKYAARQPGGRPRKKIDMDFLREAGY